MKQTVQKYSFLFAGIAAIALLLCTTQQAFAQEVQRVITIVPPSIELNLNPGDKTEGILKVINDSDTPLTFNASTQDFIVEDIIGTPDFVPQDTFDKPYSAAAWIGVYPDYFTIAPHEQQQLSYYVQVPSTARPGGHYAGVLYTPTKALGLGAGSGAAVNTQIGTLFSLAINGPIHEEAHVSAFAAPGFSEYGPVSVATEIRNLGDLHIKPIGTITVYDMFGRKVGAQLLASHNIFPQAARDYVNIFGQHWMLGPFTAKFAATYGRDNNLPLIATVTFWVFPWKVGIVVLLAIVAIILGIMVWKKKKNGPEEMKEQKVNNQPQVPPQEK